MDLIVELPNEGVRGRNNVHIWNCVNWNNPHMAIAARLGVSNKAVSYQAKKRGLKSLFPRGGRLPRGRRVYREGQRVKLPHPLPQL